MALEPLSIVRHSVIRNEPVDQFLLPKSSIRPEGVSRVNLSWQAGSNTGSSPCTTRRSQRWTQAKPHESRLPLAHAAAHAGCSKTLSPATQLAPEHAESISLASPFTERESLWRTWGGSESNTQQKATTQADALDAFSRQQQFGSSSVRCVTAEEEQRRGEGNEDEDGRSDEIALRLPELRQVLQMLREKKEAEQRQAGGGAEKHGGPGNVFLVGTGPGDPDLLTVKALKLLQSATLVLYDRLVSTDILDLIHEDARLLYVGKTAGYHSRTQEEIHELLLSFAEVGATVVRLKGGDPLVFGRGGEEMDFLQARGIRVQIVPGITAASGIAAELGIPLTHRGLANSVRFLTGHSRKGGADPLHVAEGAADVASTLVVYMGLSTLPGLAQKLMANGLPGSTPAVAVERGTTPQQRLVFDRLEAFPSSVETAGLVSPALIVIGQVVALSHLWPSKLSNGEGKGVEGGNPQRSNNIESRNRLLQEPRDRSLRGADPALPSERL